MKKQRLKLSRVLICCILAMVLFVGCGQRWYPLWEKKTYYDPSSQEKNHSDADLQEIMQPDPTDEKNTNLPHDPGAQITLERYAYGKLSEEGKKIYDTMLSAILNYEETVKLDSKDVELMETAYMALASDYGNLFWVEGYTYTRHTKGERLVGLSFSPHYTMTEPEKKEKQRQVEAVAAEWLAGSGELHSDYEKAKYVFETLIEKVDYVEGAADSQNILSVFLNRQTVCQGYASATQYLLGQLGVSCAIVTGEARDGANGGPHAWNLVKLDETYYYMDTTWGNGAYYSENGNEKGKFVNYNFLCMTDSEAANFYQPDAWLLLPACSSMEHNYYVREGRYFEAWNPEDMGAAFRAAWEAEGESVSLKCANLELCEKIKDYFITQGRIGDYCRGIEYVYYMESPEFCVITVNFNEM